MTEDSEKRDNYRIEIWRMGVWKGKRFIGDSKNRSKEADTRGERERRDERYPV